ncbi:SDR family NAD(P)-dependent oxidoreductase [Virgibacillus halodenitrificans]|uniref:SDR family NAD(P)-dependent oxidoreductase n=1 Tax=Virgibacillus halodenitrificans TaxID=1482 RepID=UPI001F38AFB8|nr:SDR family oxidoreductase [Virgibacillus halodenitrificans]
MGRLTGKVALVTGAGTGLGRAIAISFAKAGATVILNGRREEKLREVAKEIGEGCFIIPADLTKESEVNTLVDELQKNTAGELDILVNNAGGVNAMEPIEKMSLQQWQQMFDLNLTTQFLTTRAFLPLLRKSEHGKIISVTSGMVNFFMKGMGAYSASKAGVEALMKTVAEEEKDNGIQVNLFDPLNVVSEGNPNGEYEPAEIVDVLVDLAAADSVQQHGEIVKPEV